MGRREVYPGCREGGIPGAVRGRGVYTMVGMPGMYHGGYAGYVPPCVYALLPHPGYTTVYTMHRSPDQRVCCMRRVREERPWGSRRRNTVGRGPPRLSEPQECDS